MPAFGGGLQHGIHRHIGARQPRRAVAGLCIRPALRCVLRDAIHLVGARDEQPVRDHIVARARCGALAPIACDAIGLQAGHGGIDDLTGLRRHRMRSRLVQQCCQGQLAWTFGLRERTRGASQIGLLG